MWGRTAWILGLAVAVLAGGPRGAAADLSTIMLSESQEVELGRAAAPEVEKEFGRYEDPELESYLNEVGQRLVALGDIRGYRYSFKVVNRPEPNAFALPGGHIYVTRGLLALVNNEAELAGVLGHEIAHVNQRHIAKQLTRAVGYQILALGIVALTAANPGTRGSVGAAVATMQGLMATIMTGYSRDLEAEADEVGMRTAARTGYDPGAVAGFMRAMRTYERLTGQGYHAFQDHPATNERVVKAETQAELLRTLRTPGGSFLVRGDEYKAHLDGLRYGSAQEDLKLRIYTVKVADRPAEALGVASPPGSEGRARWEITVHTGDKLADVSRHLVGDGRAAWELAVLNGMRERDALRPGQKLKAIVRGDTP
jgi:predicted Zn-dependent protease